MSTGVQLGKLDPWADGYAAGVRDARAGLGVLILATELAGVDFTAGYVAGAESVTRPDVDTRVPVPIMCDERERVAATRRTTV